MLQGNVPFLLSAITGASSECFYNSDITIVLLVNHMLLSSKNVRLLRCCVGENSFPYNNLTNKGRNIMNKTFDISQVPAETRKGPATWGQIRALGFRLAGSKGGKPNYKVAKQIQGCLYNEAKEGRFSFDQASKLFDKKTLPVKYRNMIRDYIAQS